MGIYSANLAHSMLNLINSYRSQEGLRPLKSIQNLEGAAKDQALYMCENSSLTHENPGGDLQQRTKRNGFRGLSIGENIAKNHSDGYGEVGRMWMNSPLHKKNIMGDFTYSGIATCLDKDGNRYWAQVFGGDGQGGQEPPSGNRMDGSFPPSDETMPEGLGDSYSNPIDDQGSLEYKNIARPNSTSPRLDRRSNRSPRESMAPEAKRPELSYKARSGSFGEICFNIDDCRPSRAARPFTAALDSGMPSKFTVTQVKTSYVPVSSIIYKTLTRTVPPIMDISATTSCSSDKLPATQTVFMIINTSVTASTTTVTSTAMKSEAPSIVKPTQTSVSTVTITSSNVEPKFTRKTITVTEAPQPKQITVTVTSKTPHSTSTVNVEKTVTAAPSPPSPERIVTVVRQSPILFPSKNHFEDLTPNRIKLRIVHRIPDLESDNNLEYLPKKMYDGYKESWLEPKIAVYEPIETLSLKPSGQEYSFPRRRLRFSSRYGLKQENPSDGYDVEMPKYPKNDGIGHHYLGTYYTSDPATSKSALQLSPENGSQDQAQYLNNPCGSQSNPCVRTVLMRG